MLSAWQYSHLNAVHTFGSHVRVPHFGQTTWRESRGGPDMLEGYDRIVSERKGHVVAATPEIRPGYALLAPHTDPRVRVILCRLASPTPGRRSNMLGLVE